MRFVTNYNDHYVLQLPVWVGAEALRKVMEELLAPGRRALLILDFQKTMHIQLQALQQFAAGIRQLGPLPRPIVLAGLNPYCEQILRFVLIPPDWDQFLEVTGELELTVPRGNGMDEEFATQLERTREGGLPATFTRFCPN